MTRIDRPLDNPINWSFHIGRLFGVNIRVHCLFLVCAVILLAMEIPETTAANSHSFGRVISVALGTYILLFCLVLLHEFGHCFGARFTGGEADEIVLWPLGGFAKVRPPHEPSAHLVTILAGPLANAFFCIASAVVIVIWTGSIAAIPWNPLHPTMPVDASIVPTTGQEWLLRSFGISYLLLLLNLLPMFPLDGGRALSAWLWAKRGERDAVGIAAGVGMITAIPVGLFALFLEDRWLLLMIAMFGYITCWQARRSIHDGEIDDWSAEQLGVSGFDGSDAPKKSRRLGFWERRRLRKRAEEIARTRDEATHRERRVDEILSKVSTLGIRALTSKERRILEDETRRRREVLDET